MTQSQPLLACVSNHKEETETTNKVDKKYKKQGFGSGLFKVAARVGKSDRRTGRVSPIDFYVLYLEVSLLICSNLSMLFSTMS